jgi:hypothetical protein
MEPKGNKNFMGSIDIKIGINFTFNAQKFKKICGEFYTICEVFLSP